MCKLCWLIVLALLLVIAVAAYRFVSDEARVSATDGRQVITLQAAERDFVLAEMRMFLTSVQGAVTGMAANDMQAVADAARLSGRAAQQSVPAALVTKLPMRFKRLGFDTHGKFDELALDAEQLGDSGHSLSQLGVLMENCLTCHAVYRFEVEKNIKNSK